MSAENPPTYNFNGIDFNPGFYTEATTVGSGISQGEADNRYLIKIQPDTSDSIQTFTQGIQTYSGAIEAVGGNILTNSGNITTNSGDVISTLGTVRGRFCNITLYGTIPTLYSDAIDARVSSSSLTLGQNQIDGLLNIGNNANRTATINISTGATTTANIVNIGNDTTNNQTLNLNSKTINVGNATVVSAINIISPSTFTGTAIFNGLCTASRINTSTAGTAVFDTNVVCPKFNGGVLSTNTLTIADVQVSGITDICCNSLRSGNINISNTSNVAHNIIIGNDTSNNQTLNLNSKTINVGNATATTTITLNKPLNPAYLVISNISAIGGTTSNSPGATACSSGTAVTVASVANVPFGVYQVFYQIKYTITVASIPFTEQRVGLCNTINAINSVYNQIESLENQAITRPVGSYSITGSGIWVNNVTPALSTAYLNVRNTFTVGTLSADATLRIVRIG